VGTSHKALERLALREHCVFTAGGERVNHFVIVMVMVIIIIILMVDYNLSAVE
jgi:hypothetical protein